MVISPTKPLERNKLEERGVESAEVGTCVMDDPDNLYKE